MKTKVMHAGALTCFAIAILFYIASWSPGALGLAVFGVFFEVVAWVQILDRGSDKSAES
jgi:asparagine N-glycosylation enzyme membrane subunit Stt3